MHPIAGTTVEPPVATSAITYSYTTSSICPEHRRSTEVARLIGLQTCHLCIRKQHQELFSFSTRVRGDADEQTKCLQRRCSSKRLCVNQSSMKLFCHESHPHVQVLRICLVDSDPPSSNGLLSCALKTLSS